MLTFKIAILLLMMGWTFWYMERLHTSSDTGVTNLKT